MRILHVVPTYLPATRYGGPIYSVHGLARAQAALGHEVTVFTTNVDGSTVSPVPLGRDVPLDGVAVRYFPAVFRRLYWSPSMKRALDAEAGEHDVIHAHSIFLWPTRGAARAARAAGVPLIISPRGMLVADLIARRSRWVKSVWIRSVERDNFRNAAAIHFTSQREWDDARRIDIPLPAPFVVPNGIDAAGFSRGLIREPHVLYLGRLNWKKGLDRLLGALALLPQVRIVIAGNDDDGYRSVLNNLARDLGVIERITFAGPVSGIEKEELLARASMLVLASYSENFGNVVLEALASGTPVIVTPEVGLAEMVRAAGAGLITTGDPGDLARCIGELLADPAGSLAMGERGRIAVEASFTWTAVAQAMICAYQSLGPLTRVAS